MARADLATALIRPSRERRRRSAPLESTPTLPSGRRRRTSAVSMALVARPIFSMRPARVPRERSIRRVGPEMRSTTWNTQRYAFATTYTSGLFHTQKMLEGPKQPVEPDGCNLAHRSIRIIGNTRLTLATEEDIQAFGADGGVAL